MITVVRTNSGNKDFQNLVNELDKDLAKRNGDTNDFFVQFNTLHHIKNVVVAFNETQAAGCGAIKEYDNITMEIKRMYVPLQYRGKGVAVALLQHLENWAKELGYSKCVLETGNKMPEAIGLYKKSGYNVIANYGQYKNVESSICFEKIL